LTEYSGEKFYVTWETAEDVLIRAYSKVMGDNTTRIRLERQEYPRIPLADATVFIEGLRIVCGFRNSSLVVM
jgi:hypothetical protein